MEKEELKEIIKQAIKEAQSEKKMTLTLEEVVKETGIGRNTITALINAPNTDFPYLKVGRKLLVNRDKLVEWLDKVSQEHRTIGGYSEWN